MSRFIQLWLLLGLLLTAPPLARAQLAEGNFAEELVRADYVEGLPYAEARDLTLAGIERLVEMLRDPAEALRHSNWAVTARHYARWMDDAARQPVIPKLGSGDVWPDLLARVGATIAPESTPKRPHVYFDRKATGC